MYFPTHLITVTGDKFKKEKNTNKRFTINNKHHNGHPWFLPFYNFQAIFVPLLFNTLLPVQALKKLSTLLKCDPLTDK